VERFPKGRGRSRFALAVRLRHLAAAAVAVLAGALACSREPRIPAEATAAPPPAAFDWARPVSALDLGAEDASARLGSFEWSGAVEWTVSGSGADARQLRAVEHHRLRQSATGDFEVNLDLDPTFSGSTRPGAGANTGRDVILVGGMTYARERFAPYRERPTDHGRDARRYRDESFRLARSVAALLGPALELRAAGDAEVLRRPAKRFTVALAKGAARPEPAAAEPGDPPLDGDTKRRRAFLDGLRPQSASGEVLLDAASGVPMRVRLTAAFAVGGDAPGRATVDLVAQVKGLGADVAPIAAPKNALPDERKPPGTSTALEAAGLKKRGETAEKKAGEPGDEGED
jgi:hypothetical protein